MNRLFTELLPLTLYLVGSVCFLVGTIVTLYRAFR